MGSNQSSYKQPGCCGCCGDRYDYKQEMEKLRKKIDDYYKSLEKGVAQFKDQNQKLARQNFNQVQQTAYEYVKNSDLKTARKILSEYHQKQKQPLLIKRQADFLIDKQRDVMNLKQRVETAEKPKKNIQKRNQIIKFYEQLELIKNREFDKNQDQISGDSRDIQAQIDREIDVLKSRIPPETHSEVIEEPQKQKSVVKEPTPEQYRDKFLRKLGRSRQDISNRFRKFTVQEIQFFQTKLNIRLKQSKNSSNSARNRSNNQKPNSPIYYQQDQTYNFANIDSSLHNTSRNYSQSTKIDNDSGYYLSTNCQGLDYIEMEELVKGDWSMVQVIDLQLCNISSFGWRQLAKAQAIAFPNLKVVFLALNKVWEVTSSDLACLRGVKYLSFGWWDQSNQLSDQSKKVLSQFRQRNPQLILQFPQ